MRIVKLNAALTAIFVIVSVLAVAIFNSPLRKLVAIVDLLLFAVGVATFIWGYFSAVQRSRSDEISVAGLFLLIDGVATKSVMRIMNSALAIQVAVGLGGALVRRSTMGSLEAPWLSGCWCHYLGLD